MPRSADIRHRLDFLIAPRSIAIVGASERNHFSNLAMRALRGLDYQGPIHLVNHNASSAYGFASVKRCSEIGTPVEAAFLCVPLAGLLDTARDAIAAGIRNLVVVSSGFREIGGDGARREAELMALCQENGVRALGPNCLGFRNNLTGVALGSMPFVEQPTQPTIALISASGSVAASVINYGIPQGVGFTHVIATGNEMDVTTADLIDYLSTIDEVRAICLFIEGIKDASAFIAAAERAREAKKPIVALKVGSAETTAAVAAAHTGAAVGDDKVFDALCDRYAIVRVETIEQLVNTAATIAATGPIARPGVALVSISGGVCEIASDYGHKAGLLLPQFAAETRSELGSVISDFGQMYNPLDMTGAAVRDEELWLKIPEIVSRDPAVGLTLLTWDIPAVEEPSMPKTVRLIGQSVQQLATPALIVNNVERPLNEHGRAYLAANNQMFAPPGLGHALYAASKLAWWSGRVNKSAPVRPNLQLGPTRHRPCHERQTLDFLVSHGVPVIPSHIAHSKEEAIATAGAIGEPVALKILSRDIAHKNEVGGVALDLRGDDALASAYDDMITAVSRNAPNAAIDGVLVVPMRRNGVELLVGVARDPQWGLVCALGLGGFWVEALADTALCLVPSTQEEIISAISSLRGIGMLRGYRGIPAVDLNAVATVVSRICEAALALGDDLAALEVNPLFVSGSRVEALDALAVFNNPCSGAAR